MTSYRRGPRKVDLALEHARLTWAPATFLAEVQSAWPEVVGASIAKQATPVRVSSGVLTVSCAASVWAQELDLMGPAIIGRLQDRVHRGQVTKLRCVTVPVSDSA